MTFKGVKLAGALAVFSCLIAGAPAGVAMADKTVSADAAVATHVVPAVASQSKGAASTTLDDVKWAFETRFPGIAVTQVREAPVSGLYEVQVGMGLVYVDAQVDYVLQGSLIDAHTHVDLTAARLEKLAEVPFDTLPFEHAIKIVRGDGSRQLAVFEDPNCVYCKRLHASLNELDNYTLYSFQFPILSPDSREKSRNIWCASNPAQALQNWMLNGKAPAAAHCDDDPAEQVLALGQRLMVRGTPAIIFGDGSRVNGTLPTDALRTRLDALD